MASSSAPGGHREPAQQCSYGGSPAPERVRRCAGCV